MKKIQGFTLIELMIVLAIIAIISAVGYPSYQNSVRKANRADGLALMADTAGKLERCFTVYGAYNNTNCTITNGSTIHSEKLHYDVVVTSAAATYSLTATPVSAGQLLDTKCATFTLTSAGVKSSTPTGNTCW